MFAGQLGSLCKLLFLSSAIHQLVFVARSTLPFAVGQVSVGVGVGVGVGWAWV